MSMAVASKTARNLIDVGQGVSVLSGKRTMTFDAAVDLKPGATLDFRVWNGSTVDDYLYTVQGGAGASYVTDQIIELTGYWGGYYGGNLEAGMNYVYTSDRSTSRARGSDRDGYPTYITAPYRGVLVPDATHFIYWSPFDDAANPDYYVYVDTLEPERGIHPYTRDKVIASFKTAPLPKGRNVAGRMIADLATRVREVEGAMRAGRPSGSKSQDYRIADLLARFYALEQWANSAGHFGTPPAVGSNTTYTEKDFIDAGDPA